MVKKVAVDTVSKVAEKVPEVPAKPKSKKLKRIILGILALGILVGGLFVYDKFFGLPVLFISSKKPTTVTPKIGKIATAQNVSGQNGGTVTLNGAKGVYNLNFPPESLMKGERVTAQEISSLKGLKIGWKFLGGVQVGPDSAMFARPANLTFKTQSTSDNLAAFSYDADGKDFHFIPADFKDGLATISVFHFSGFGVIDLGSGRPQAGEPSTGHLRYEAAKAVIVNEAAAENEGGIEENDAYAQRLYNLLHAWYAATVKPRLTSAINSGDGADGAVLEFIQLKAHTQEIPGGEENLSAEITEGMNLSAQAIKAGLEKASKKCVSERDASQAAVMIRLMALAEMDDFQGRIPGITDDEITKRVKNCANFKLTMKSTVSTDIEGHIYSDSAEGEGVLTVSDDLKLSGEGKITVTDMQAWLMSCVWNETDNFKVEDVQLTFRGDKKAEMTIQIWPNEDSYTCVNADDTFTSTGTNTGPWWGAYANAHDDETPSFASDMFTMKDWEIINQNGVYARKSYDRTRYPSQTPWWLKAILKLLGGEHPMSDQTTWELIHLPRN